MKKIYLTLMLLISVASLFGQRFSSGVQEIGDILSLSNLSPVDGERIYVQGYYSQFDGGEGFLYYDANKAKSEANAGSIIDPSNFNSWDGTQSNFESTMLDATNGQGGSAVTGNGVWVRESKDFTLNQFGLVDNIALDQTAATINAMSAVLENQSLEFTFMVLTNSFTVPTQLNDKVKIFSKNRSGGFLFTDDAGVVRVMTVGDYNTIESLVFDYTAISELPSSSGGIFIEGKDSISIVDCYFEGTIGAFITAQDQCNDLLIERNYLKDGKWMIYGAGVTGQNQLFLNNIGVGGFVEDGNSQIHGDLFKWGSAPNPLPDNTNRLNWRWIRNSGYNLERDVFDLALGGVIDATFLNNTCYQSSDRGTGFFDIKLAYNAAQNNPSVIDDFQTINVNIIGNHAIGTKSMIVLTAQWDNEDETEASTNKLINISNNTFRDVAKAIFLKSCSFVTVDNNKFYNVKNFVTTSTNSVIDNTYDYNMNRKIKFSNNTILFSATDTENNLFDHITQLDIIDNRFYYYGNINALYFDECEDVLIKGNRFESLESTPTTFNFVSLVNGTRLVRFKDNISKVSTETARGNVISVTNANNIEFFNNETVNMVNELSTSSWVGDTLKYRYNEQVDVSNVGFTPPSYYDTYSFESQTVTSASTINLDAELNGGLYNIDLQSTQSQDIVITLNNEPNIKANTDHKFRFYNQLNNNIDFPDNFLNLTGDVYDNNEVAVLEKDTIINAFYDGTNFIVTPSLQTQASSVFTNTNSIEFNGTSSSIAISDDAAIEPSTAFTVSMWVKIDGNISTSYLWSKGLNGDYWARCSHNNSNNGLNFQVRDSGGGSNFLQLPSSTFAYNDNNWHHLVFVYEASTALRIYADGTEVSTNTTSIPANANDNSRDLTIGSQDGASSFMDGFIDEFSIYSAVLSSGDITSLYNSGTPTDQTGNANLSFWLRMGDLISGSTLPDQVGSNDGTNTDGTVSTDIPN